MSHKNNIDEELKALSKEIIQQVQIRSERAILQSVITFINSILRTNFYKTEKVSVSYMYKPDFLSQVDYPVTPLGFFR